MHIVIDIPENYDLSKIQNGSIASKIILNAVANGTPFNEVLNMIKDEIKQYQSHLQEGCIVWNELEKCLRIIEKYREVKE